MDPRVTSLAAGQKGLLTHAQLSDFGWSNDRIQHILDTGYVIQRQRSISAVTGAPATKDQAILAAVLTAGPDAAGSHRASAEVLHVPGFGALGYEVVRFSEQQIRDRLEYVARTLREKLRRAA